MQNKLLTEERREAISRFFLGPLYPAAVALTVLIGHITGWDFWLMIPHCLCFALSLLIVPSAKHSIIFFTTFLYQISIAHTPGKPTYATYYFTGVRLVLLILMALALIGGFICFYMRTKLYRNVSFRNTPLLFPTLLLAVAFLMNGAFTQNSGVADVLFGAVESVAYLGFFLLFYTVLCEEDLADIGSYFSYITLLTAGILLGQLLHLYLTSDLIFVDGAINKDAMLIGWGQIASIGSAFIVLLPMLFYGAASARRPLCAVGYFVAASATLLGGILTLSRNAILIGGAIYVACLVILCFTGRHRKLFRIIALAGVVLLAGGCLVLHEKIRQVFADLFSRGLSDNGRFAIWRECLSKFTASPVFGVGFTGLNPEGWESRVFPRFAHNTLLQMLCSTGVLGLLVYLYYRVATVRLFFTRPSLLKMMLGLSALTLLLGGMLDVFPFTVHPVFYYAAALAVAARLTEKVA